MRQRRGTRARSVQPDGFAMEGGSLTESHEGKLVPEDEVLVGLCTECRRQAVALAVHDGTLFGLAYGTCRECAGT